MVRPIRPLGGVPGSPAKPKADPVPEGFRTRLADGLSPARPEAPVDPRLSQVRRFASRALGAEVSEPRLLESYDALSADEGLYEVRSEKGVHQVIRSRSGALSIYPAP